MKKLLSFLVISSGVLFLCFSPGDSWGSAEMPERGASSPGKSFTGAFKEKAHKEMEEIKKGTRDAGREMKESARGFSKEAGKELQKTGKAVKETGKEIKKNVRESWENLRNLFKK